MLSRKTLIAYARLPHFIPTLCVLIATGVLGWLATRDEFEVLKEIRLLLAMLGGQLLIGVTNELVDESGDRLTKPDKPLPSGAVSHRGAVAMALVGLILMVGFGVTFGRQSFVLLLAGTGIGIVYSFWFKRTRWAWIPYVLALPLLPIWMAVSLNAFEPALLAIFPMGAMGSVALQLAQSVPDVTADRLAGIDSWTTRLGEVRSMQLIWSSLLATLLIALVAAALLDEWSRMFVLAGVASAFLVAVSASLYRFDSALGVKTAFPMTAVAVGSLAVAWFAVVLD